jgi:hypothetical protein
MRCPAEHRPSFQRIDAYQVPGDFEEGEELATSIEHEGEETSRVSRASDDINTRKPTQQHPTSSGM